MSFTDEFLTGVCQAIADNPDASFPYAFKTGSDVYLPGEVAVAWEVEPITDQSVVVSAYPVADDHSLSDSVIGVQFRVAGPDDMAFVNGAIDDLFDLFHGLQATILGGVKVVMAQRRSGAALGQDERGRVSRSENFYFTVHRPSKNRT